MSNGARLAALVVVVAVAAVGLYFAFVTPSAAPATSGASMSSTDSIASLDAPATPGLDASSPGAPPAEAFAGFAMGTRTEMLKLEAELLAAHPQRLSVHVIRSPRYRDWMCEIAPAGVTKWTGVTAVAAGWGIAAAEICAVGDDVNDLPMVRNAGLGVAMGNAVAELRAAADCVVATHDDGGIAAVVDLLLAGLA